MSADAPDRTRLQTLRTIQAAITADIEDQTRKIIELGASPKSAFHATRVWWASMVRSAIRDARDGLEDVL